MFSDSAKATFTVAIIVSIAFVITTVTALVANEAIKKIPYQPIIQKKN